MRIVFAIIGLLILLVLAFFFTQNYLGFFGPKASITIKDKTFTVEVAKTPKEKQVGLSSKISIAQDYGMYFPFEKTDYYAFWMKNMKFPIDIIFIKDNKIVTIHDSVPAPKSDTDNLPLYQPDEPANAVFEITAGLSKKYGFAKGDSVTLQNISK